MNKPAFISEFLKIATKGSEDESGVSSFLISLVPNKTQLHYLANRRDRNVILKARQLGTTTIILAEFFIDTILTKGLQSVVVSHGDKPTRRLFNKVHIFHSQCPVSDFMPRKGHDAEHMMSFPNLNSAFYVETARARITGRGDTVHRCLLSEFPMYDIGQPGRAKEILAEIGQSVPLKTGVLTIESSPRFKNDEFYNLYFGAVNGDNNYTAFFFPWWMGEDYVITSDEVAERFSEDKDEWITLDSNSRYPKETLLVEEKGLTLDQIRWRRYKIREMREKFFREYPEDDQSCWLNPEAMRFSAVAIDRLMRIRTRPIEYDADNYMTVWEYPQGNELYVIGADVSEGLPQGDWSAARVLKVSNGTYVASIRAKIPIDVYAKTLAEAGKLYNHAMLAVENSPHGSGVLRLLENMGYPNLYWTMDDKGKPVKLGWTTSYVSRPRMIDNFDMALNAGLFRDSDEEALAEYQSLVYINGNEEVPPGEHSDLLFASMIAWEIRGWATPINIQTAQAERYGIFA